MVSWGTQPHSHALASSTPTNWCLRKINFEPSSKCASIFWQISKHMRTRTCAHANTHVTLCMQAGPPACAPGRPGCLAPATPGAPLAGCSTAWPWRPRGGVQGRRTCARARRSNSITAVHHMRAPSGSWECGCLHQTQQRHKPGWACLPCAGFESGCSGASEA